MHVRTPKERARRALRPRFLHRPRRTVRLRLTLLYGSLFLASGALLLAVTYVLVRDATGNSFVFESKNGSVASFSSGTIQGGGRHGALSLSGGAATNTKTAVGSGLSKASHLAPPLTPKQALAQAHQFQALAAQQHATELHQLLIKSGVALAITALLAIVLGWLVAGRVLRPLRTITAAARHLSASNLHERLALAGPDDELKELGDTFDDLLGRLEASFDSQRQFVANASHELRTPLARQRTLVQVALADPGATASSLRSAHERVLVSGRQQEQLIESLLTLSRVQAGTARREPFDLATLTGALLAARSAEIDLGGFKVAAELASAPMFGDPHLVERLVVNLLDNALRHNRPNGSLEVMTGGCDGLASLSVANDGPVIRPADIDRLFEPFQRLAPERTGTGEGFGLGLCIVRAVATAQGALLRARVRPQGGLVVDVRFPMTDRGPDDPEAKRRRFSGTRAPAIDRSPGTPVETEGVAALR